MKMQVDYAFSEMPGIPTHANSEIRLRDIDKPICRMLHRVHGEHHA